MDLAQNGRMTHPGQLGDQQLLMRSHMWRYQATCGMRNARQHAQAHEAEVRRRFADETTMLSTLEVPLAMRRRPFWRFW
ncbi:MAG: hypothetical protein EOP78_00280 [Variovorax sp.]|nr:MAG: hypothetical protein EOP78_00280 [Variovorax sp.]